MCYIFIFHNFNRIAFFSQLNFFLVYNRCKIRQWIARALCHKYKYDSIDFNTRPSFHWGVIWCGTLWTKIACVGVTVYRVGSAIFLIHMHNGIFDIRFRRHTFISNNIAKFTAFLLWKYIAVIIVGNHNHRFLIIIL